MNGWPMRLEGAITSLEAIVAAIVGAALGGAGIVGLVFAYIRRFIDKRLAARDAEDEKKRKTRLRRLTIEDEMEHATGRLFFFIHKAIVSGQHNGDLESAWEKYQEVEEKKKDLDRQIRIESELDE